METEVYVKVNEKIYKITELYAGTKLPTEYTFQASVSDITIKH